MRLVTVREFGGPEVLDVIEQPAPAPGAGQALVQVAYAPVLFLDTQMRAGRAREWFSTRPPYTPGAGVAGTVAAVGDEVDAAWIGRDIVAAAREVTVTGIEQVQLAPDEARRLVRRVLAEAAAGSLRPIIGQRFSLDHAGDAHRAIESRGVIGKTLLEV